MTKPKDPRYVCNCKVCGKRCWSNDIVLRPDLMSVRSDCTESCAAMPECAVCHQRKKPMGRDSAAAGPTYCDFECHGYLEGERAGHLWPAEWREHVNGVGE